MHLKYILLFLSLIAHFGIRGQIHNPDVGEGRYQNPIIFADYSDPDVVHVGEDFFMVSSSFNCAPGLPILHSRDLVHWQLVNYVFDRQVPADHFSQPRHGDGAWAPSIRYHKGEYYVFYGDPDFGIYMVKTADPFGDWEEPHLVRAAKGWIDPCPFWAEDGQAYLVHAFAGSRAGVKSVLVLHKMAPDGKSLLDDGVVIIDGHEEHPTIEGPKMYARDGYYYVFAPGGGVTEGWQTVLRARNIYGPYEAKIVLEQGSTDINGPHQGGWVELDNGENWFLHFQDMGPWGRVVHLQPVRWEEGWPVMGVDKDGNGIGEPVRSWKKPDLPQGRALVKLNGSDDFDSPFLNLQWQWHGNPEAEWAFPTAGLGFLRMNAVLQEDTLKNLWSAPHLLMQKFAGPAFTASAKVKFNARQTGDKIGLIIMGRDYSYLSIEKRGHGLRIRQVICPDAENGGKEVEAGGFALRDSTLILRVDVDEMGKCRFSFSTDGSEFVKIGSPFQAREGKWIGAKVGLFCQSGITTNDRGTADIDWFKMEPYEKLRPPRDH